MCMRRTIYLPDELDARVEEYLRENPKANLSALVREALERKLAAPDLSPLLELAGIVKESRPVKWTEEDRRQRPEDMVVIERRP
jgi:hypothetical protein